MKALSLTLGLFALLFASPVLAAERPLHDRYTTNFYVEESHVLPEYARKTIPSLIMPSARTALQYQELVNYMQRWQDGEVVAIYRSRNRYDSYFHGESRGGLRTCMAIRDAAGYERHCEKFEITLR